MENHTKKIFIDPICNEEECRLTVYPIAHPKIWQVYKVMQAAIWNAEEIDFSKIT